MAWFAAPAENGSVGPVGSYKEVDCPSAFLGAKPGAPVCRLDDPVQRPTISQLLQPIVSL